MLFEICGVEKFSLLEICGVENSGCLRWGVKEFRLL
jgi:hypothetical protein